MDVLGLLLPPPETFGLAPFVASKFSSPSPWGPPSRLDLRQGPVPDPKPTPAAVIARAKYLQTKWPDAVKAQLTEGWKAFVAKAPSEEAIIEQVAGTAAEQASASMLKMFDLVTEGVNLTIGLKLPGQTTDPARKQVKLKSPTAVLESELKAFEKRAITDPSAAGRARGQAALDEMKKAMTDKGGIDPTSQKAFSFIESALTGTPITAGLTAAQTFAAKEINELLGLSKDLEPILRKVTGLYTNLHGAAKAVATLLLAGAVGAGGIAMGMSPVLDVNGKEIKGAYTFTPPPLVLAQIAPWVPDIGLDSFTVNKGELTQLAASLSQAVGKTGFSATAAATYKKGGPGTGGVGLSYAQTRGRIDTQASVQATLDAQQKVSASARASAGIKTGRKNNVDTRLWAQADLSPQGKASGSGGIEIKSVFGTTPAERQARRAARKEAREARRAIRRAHRANPAIVRKLTGPLPGLQHLFRAKPGEVVVAQPYLDPPPAGFPWGLAFGVGVVGLGVLGWTQRERLTEAWADFSR